MVGSGALSQVEERVAESVERKVAAAAIRRFARRAIRAAALEALKKSYKLLLDEIPIVGIASDISTIRDVIQLGKEFESVRITARAAKDFVDLGPRRVQDLYVDDQVQSFPSYPDFVKADASRFAENELEKRYGAAGPGMHYHHIIERGSGLPETITESTDNIVRIPEVLHDEINARYAIKDARWGGMSLREWLKKKSPWVQRYWGERIMREMGMIR
jgi:hypothetical protein